MSSWSSTRDWLKGFSLEHYHSSFIENGYETQKLCANLKDEDLDGMNITNSRHREILLNQALVLWKSSTRSSSFGSESPTATSPQVRDNRKGKSGNVEKLPVITDTDTYTAVFDDTSSQVPVPSKPIKRKKPPRSPKPSIDSPPRPHQKGPVKLNPSSFAARQKTEGASMLASIPPTLMTKLQLKVRIRDMLARDHIVLSHAKYVTEEGTANEVTLIELAENYADELHLEGLNVYDAVMDIWRYASNEKSEYVLPKSVPTTPAASSALTESPNFNGFIDQSNYSEPFDANPGPVKTPAKFTSRKMKSDTNNGKSVTLKPTSPTPSSNYAEPFDAVKSQPVIIKSSPEIKHESTTGESKPNYKLSSESPTVERGTSKTLPPASSPNLSTSSEETGPRQQSPRKKSPFHKSEKHLDVHVKQKGKSTSAEDLSNPDLFKENRMSLPPTDLSHSVAISRSISSNPALLYEECLKDAKKITGSYDSLDKLQPNLSEQFTLEQEAIDSQSFKVASRIKGLTVTKRASSEFELSNVLEVYVEGSEIPVRFQKFKSSETESSVTEDTDGKEEKKKSLLRRLFHKKKDKVKDKSKMKHTSVDSGECGEDNDERKGLTNSTSMPDIAAAAVHSEYAEVFDIESDSKKQTLSPPKLPSRNRPHSAKSSTACQPSSTLFEQSPYMTPISHHTIMLKSESTSSNEVIHSAPEAITSQNDVIEINILSGNAHNNEPQAERQTTSEIKSSASATHQNVLSKDGCQVNQYDDPWKPILVSQPKSQKIRILSSNCHGTGEWKESTDGVLGKPHSMSDGTPSPPLHESSPLHDPPLLHPNPLPTEESLKEDHLENMNELTNENPTCIIQSETNGKVLHQTKSPKKAPKPLGKKTGSKPVPLSSNSLQVTLEEKLVCDGIDITLQPYSSQRGEYGVPSALVSRYSEETGNTEDEVAKTLDKIRRYSLLKARRGHIALKKDWKKFSDIATGSVDDFLVSVGLPQYQGVMLENGITTVTQLKGSKWNSLPIQDSHKRRLSAFSKKL